ncbi:hypothetical protein ENUP19_0119G0018 [Entamoeba nuttalli]|uniref:RWD domain-containing protein n=2 Tax=Entamoeba nuttalli TaxID=412467 RepID=K2HBL7_ENTNP|nr:hypothetical protein ENU1_104000 [Entamoeba nuttalli P19]EKE40049.1 hypothetical protein ENU1_104000 [Entamoeba nuttalli P19]|eukprot:XP_008857616.1 hypothetical protein ENU1_104000 [Entamoeba nuttalli P19]
MKIEELKQEYEILNSVFPGIASIDETTQQLKMKIFVETPDGVILKLVEDEFIQYPYSGKKEITINKLPPIEVFINQNDSCNEYTMSCIWITEEQGNNIINRLNEIEEENDGIGFLYGWYLYLVDIVNDFDIKMIDIDKLEYIDNTHVFSFIGSPQHRQRAMIQFVLDDMKREFLSHTEAQCFHCKVNKSIDQFILFSQCSHSLCKQCLCEQVKYSIEKKKRLCCERCNSEVMFYELQRVINRETLEQYNLLLTLLCLEEDDETVVCPSCHTVIEIGKENKETLERTFCHNCCTYFFTNKYEITKKQKEQIKKEKELEEERCKSRSALKKNKQRNEFYFNTNHLIEEFIERITSYEFVKHICRYLNQSGLSYRDNVTISFNMNLFSPCKLIDLVKKNLTNKVIKSLNTRGFLCWHGTSWNNAESIMRDGFDTKRRSVQKFGEGEYFASHSSLSKMYGSVLLLTYVIDSRQVSRFPFGYVVNNRLSDTLCLPIACFQFNQPEEFKFDNLIKEPKSKYCKYLYHGLGIPAEGYLIEKVLLMLSRLSGKDRHENCDIVKNTNFKCYFTWLYETAQGMNKLGESDSETLTLLFNDKQTTGIIPINLELGCVSVDLKNMCILIKNHPHKLIFKTDSL